MLDDATPDVLADPTIIVPEGEPVDPLLPRLSDVEPCFEILCFFLSLSGFSDSDLVMCRARGVFSEEPRFGEAVESWLIGEGEGDAVSDDGESGVAEPEVAAWAAARRARASCSFLLSSSNAACCCAKSCFASISESVRDLKSA